MNVFYTNNFVPKGSAGCARGPLIFIRPEYKGDAGLLKHEKVHVAQAIRGLFIIHALRYLLSDSYKLACEVEAYKVQLKHSPGNALLFAQYIAHKYGLNISAENAYALLVKA